MASTASPISFCSIPEILEQILLSVSQIDLFVLQRVNLAFAGTIYGSKLLQRRLFEAVPFQEDMDNSHYRHHLDNPRTETYVSTMLHYAPYLWPFQSAQRTRRACVGVGIVTLIFDFSVSGPTKDSKQEVDGGSLGWKGRSGKIYPTGSWEKLAMGTSTGRVDVKGNIWDSRGRGRRGLAPVGGYETIPDGGNLGDVFKAAKKVGERVEKESEVSNDLYESKGGRYLGGSKYPVREK